MEKELVLNILRAIYWEIGVNYDYIDKSSENWFLDYFLMQEKQDRIIEDMLKGKRLTRLKKQMIKNTLYLGCLPKG